jgi:hypothetical protein
MGPIRDSQTPSWLSGPLTDVPAKTPLIGPAERVKCFNINMDIRHCYILLDAFLHRI